jgi:hypothetical protein
MEPQRAHKRARMAFLVVFGILVLIAASLFLPVREVVIRQTSAEAGVIG